MFTYDGEYLTDYDTEDAKDFAIYNVSAVSICGSAHPSFCLCQRNNIQPWSFIHHNSTF